MRFACVCHAAALLAAVCLSASSVSSQDRPHSVSTNIPYDAVRSQLLTMGPRGLTIEAAREHVMAILRADNSCSAWFQEADPDAAATFESLAFSLDDGPKYVVSLTSDFGKTFFKHPYSAGVLEKAGHSATVFLNANGPFFVSSANVLTRAIPGGFARFAGRRELIVGSYPGNTLPAQITTLLHELGHVVGRIPADSGDATGLSAQNTLRVLHACQAEIKASTRRRHDKSN